MLENQHSIESDVEKFNKNLARILPPSASNSQIKQNVIQQLAQRQQQQQTRLDQPSPALKEVAQEGDESRSGENQQTQEEKLNAVLCAQYTETSNPDPKMEKLVTYNNKLVHTLKVIEKTNDQSIRDLIRLEAQKSPDKASKLAQPQWINEDYQIVKQMAEGSSLACNHATSCDRVESAQDTSPIQPMTNGIMQYGEKLKKA